MLVNVPTGAGNHTAGLVFHSESHALIENVPNPLCGTKANFPTSRFLVMSGREIHLEMPVRNPSDTNSKFVAVVPNNDIADLR
jgi:hypothetical protein